MNDAQYAEYEAKLATAARLRAEILPDNKRALFEALAAAGIALVTIQFDGCGDSGQLEAPVAFDADNKELPIPLADITVRTVDFETGTIREKTMTPSDHVETLAYDFLEETHSGWENNDGAYGEFRFSLNERTVTLEYNERYIDSRHHEHEF